MKNKNTIITKNSQIGFIYLNDVNIFGREFYKKYKNQQITKRKESQI